MSATEPPRSFEDYFYGLKQTNFYVAVVLLGISVIQFIGLSIYSLYKHIRRVRHWREVHERQKDSDLLLQTASSSPVQVALKDIRDTQQDEEKIMALGWYWVIPPVTGTVMLCFWLVIVVVLEIPDEPLPYRLLFNIGIQTLLMICIVWLVFRVTDVLVPSAHHHRISWIYHELLSREKKKEGDGKHQGATGRNLIPTLMKYVKFFIIVCFALVIAQNFGFPIASILGGLGIVGVAVAFAASTILTNIFGACIIVLEELFHLGDWIMVDNVEGVVEKIGFRTTKIRQWDKRVTYIPNGIFMSNPVHNFQESKPFRIKFDVNISVFTPMEKLQELLKRVRNMIAQDKDLSSGRCVVIGVDTSSIIVQFYAFTSGRTNPKDDKDLDWNWWMPYLYLKERFIMQMIQTARDVGVDIAINPTLVQFKDAQAAKHVATEMKAAFQMDDD